MGSYQLWDVGVPMRDGVRLSADVHFPDGGPHGGPYPAVLERNCYNAQLSEIGVTGRHVDLTQAGFAVVLQDVRGRNDSAGEFMPLHQEITDGYDSVEWVAAQPWCNGRVGITGPSYMGWTSWAAVKANPPHLDAVFATVPAGRPGRQEPWNNGILMLPIIEWLNFTGGRALQFTPSVDWRRILWHLPLLTMDEALGRSLPSWRAWVSHPALDGFWDPLRFKDAEYAASNVAAYSATGWWDTNQMAAQDFFGNMRRLAQRSAEQRLLIGPWAHEALGKTQSAEGFDFGPGALLDLESERSAWFRRWLKDEAIDLPPSIRVFVTGANRWATPEEWPPPAEPRMLYLRERRLDWDRPEGGGADAFRYDPADPVIAVGGDWNFYRYDANLLSGTPDPASMAVGMSNADERPDVLVYLSEPLREPLLVAGVPTAVLHTTSDAPDTDWFVTVMDERPDGARLSVTRGQLRARFRDGLHVESLMTPGDDYELRFELNAVAHQFAAGHRLRIEITSSRFPIADRNLNTGDPIALGRDLRVATNTVFRDRERPSGVVLPVVRPADLGIQR